MRRTWLLTVGTAGLALASGGCATGPAASPPEATLAVASGVEETQVAAAAGPEPQSLAWPEAPDCRALVAAVLAAPEADRGRLRAEDSPLAIAVADGPLLVPADEIDAIVELDLPARAAADVLADGTPSLGPRCLILAERPRLAPGGGRRLVGHDVVTSEYRTGTRRRINPEHRRLRAEAEDEEGRGAGGRIFATGDPMIDLVGLVAGTVIRGVGALGPARERASDALARTERYLEEPTFEPYTYRVSSFEVGRAAAMRLTLVDRPAGRAYEARHAMRERRTFPVAEGRRATDRGLLEGTGSQAVLPADVALFETGAPRPRLSDLLHALVSAGGDGRTATVADALAVIKGPPPAAGAASPAVAVAEITPVRLDAADPPRPETARAVVETVNGPAEGTWLDAERIAVPTDALGRSMLVQVTQPDGMITFGLVERVERGGHAIVRVGRPGGRARLSDEGLESVLRDLKDR